MKNLGLAGFISLVLCTAPAVAADMALKAPPIPAPVASWTGCYIGAQAGGLWGSSDHSFSNGAPSDDSHPSGFLVGGHLGCDYQRNTFVIGAEGDLEFASITGTYSNFTGITSAGSSNIGPEGSIRGRLGVVVWDRSLLYATGGWAFADYVLGGGPAPAPPCCGFSSSPNGWTVGAGWEYMFAPNYSVRVEYRYTDYGTSTGPLSPTFPTVSMSVRNTTNTVRVGLSYKFLPF
jgi:outer membrane immunogenic protein